jgi:hypothetical protein
MCEDRRVYHASVALSDGRVLVVGGTNKQWEFVASAELYDPQSGRWTPTDSLDYTVIKPTAVALSSGHVLLTGGIRYDEQAQDGRITPHTRLYDPIAGRWVRGPDLHDARVGHATMLLRDGTVLVCGGRGPQLSVLATGECFGPYR